MIRLEMKNILMNVVNLLLLMAGGSSARGMVISEPEHHSSGFLPGLLDIASWPQWDIHNFFFL